MIRPFDAADFFLTPDVPYLFISEYHESRVDSMSVERADLAEVRRMLGLRPDTVRTCTAMAVLSDDSTARLRDYLAGQSLTCATAMEICPDALGWYVTWREHEGCSGDTWREPIVKDLRTSAQRGDVRIKAASVDDLARAYVGVILPHGGSLPTRTTGARLAVVAVVAESASIPTLVRALLIRGLRRAPRVQRLLARLGARSWGSV